MLSNGSVLSIYIAHSTSLQPSDLVVSMWDDDVELSVLVLLPNFLLSFLTCSSGTQGKSRRVSENLWLLCRAWWLAAEHLGGKGA